MLTRAANAMMSAHNTTHKAFFRAAFAEAMIPKGSRFMLGGALNSEFAPFNSIDASQPCITHKPNYSINLVDMSES